MLPASAQTLKDPSFEAAGQTVMTASDAPTAKAQISGRVADGWQDNTDWADVKVHYSLDAVHPHSGRLSQRIDVGRGFAQFVQPVRFTAGHYLFRVWLRADPAQFVEVSLREAGAPYASYVSAPVRVGPDWQEVTAEGLTPSLDGFALVRTTSPGTVWVDDADLSRPASAPGLALSPPKRPIPRVFFGLNVNHMHDAPGFLWPVVDFGAFRTWDSGDIWAHIEPDRGVYHWADLDRDVQQAAVHHVQFMLTLGQTPVWASADPTTPSVYGPGLGAPPKDIGDWKAFVRAVATRYKGRIQAYEVWNEPDQNFYTGTPAQLALLENATAEVLKQVDPAAFVVAPAVSGGNSAPALKWYDDYLGAGGGRAADVIAYHLYNDQAETDIQAIAAFRELLKAHHLDRKPVWNTESGLDRTGHTEEQGAAFVAREHIIDWALGLNRLYFYAYDNEGYFGLDKSIGLVRDAADLGPSGLAYRQVQRWLLGARMLSCASDAQGTWTCALLRPGGFRAWIVWNTNGPQAFAVPAAWHIGSRQDLMGSSAPVSSDTVPLGIQPILLEPLDK